MVKVMLLFADCCTILCRAVGISPSIKSQQFLISTVLEYCTVPLV